MLAGVVVLNFKDFHSMLIAKISCFAHIARVICVFYTQYDFVVGGGCTNRQSSISLSRNNYEVISEK